MTCTCIIQARMASTRFPGKVLALLAGKPVLTHVVQRAKQIVGIDEVVVAVPDEPRSIEIQNLCDTLDVETYAGPENDVLCRYWQVAIALGRPQNIMRLTADCPLLSPLISSEVLTLHIVSKADYTSNIFPIRTYPKGLDTEVFTFDCLEAAHLHARAPYDREHVTPWMQRKKGLIRYTVSQKRNDSELNWSVDYPDDIGRCEQVLAVASAPTGRPN